MIVLDGFPGTGGFDGWLLFGANRELGLTVKASAMTEAFCRGTYRGTLLRFGAGMGVNGTLPSLWCAVNLRPDGSSNSKTLGA